MPFTDEDLQRLKEDMNRLGDFSVGNYRLRPLVTRLKAATDLIIYVDHLFHCGSRDGDDCTCGLPERLEAWYKAAGK